MALAVVALPSFAADDLPEVRLLASSPASNAAVVRVGRDELQVVRVGDRIETTRLEVTAILPGRLEVDQTLPATADDPLRRRRLWIHRARGARPSRIQVLDREPPPVPLPGVPASPSLSPPGEPK